MKRAVDEGLDPSAAARSFDGKAWDPLLNAAELMPGNASRVYLEAERDQRARPIASVSSAAGIPMFAVGEYVCNQRSMAVNCKLVSQLRTARTAHAGALPRSRTP